MGRPARPLHDPGNHRAIERGFVRQAACRSLTKPAKPAGDQEQPGTLTPPQGARSPGSLRMSGREIAPGRGLLMADVTIEARPNGPYVVTGTIELRNTNGTVVQTQSRTVL